MKDWQITDISKAEYVGIIEIDTYGDELVMFEILKTDTHLVFGSCTNIGLLESGNMEIDPHFSLDENLQELIADLETCYRLGEEYTNMISCNDRM
jgi:hypothetical protein